tara:strand:+ start:20904 stop:22397 length:1494 start_codon:yes stop_codon:yes gene_type:complete
MQERHYKTVLYFIIAAIAVTLVMQVYWNYKNFKTGKQQLINEVQISLDNAVDNYYAALAEKNLIGFSLKDENLKQFEAEMEEMMIQIDKKGIPPKHKMNGDTLNTEMISIFTGTETNGFDTILKKIQIDQSTKSEAVHMMLKQDTTASKTNPLLKLTSKVIWAIKEDTLDLKALDTLINEELARKKIAVDYGIVFTETNGHKQRLNSNISSESALVTASKSSYLPKNSSLQLFFTNETLTILTKNIFGLLASFLFVGAIIGCLLYLLKIIRQQKQLAEVKNDLISNITHEFKTPIATIGAAMEGIQMFNSENDPEKSLRYAKISSEQVDKLNGMVEKLLETATLDSETLSLDLEEVDLVTLLQKAATKEVFASEGKSVTFNPSEETIHACVDVFHFENAINNIIDNAIKYGGKEISVSIVSLNNIEIKIVDSGNSLSEENKKQIFEKFYRVPKGNTHDVKGFGIGLYYTKKIIEKHNGTITVEVAADTTFKITLPNV